VRHADCEQSRKPVSEDIGETDYAGKAGGNSKYLLAGIEIIRKPRITKE
jgi:hypothetical protein